MVVKKLQAIKCMSEYRIPVLKGTNGSIYALIWIHLQESAFQPKCKAIPKTPTQIKISQISTFLELLEAPTMRRGRGREELSWQKADPAWAASRTMTKTRKA